MIVIPTILNTLVAKHILKQQLTKYHIVLFKIFTILCILASMAFWFKTEADSNYIAAHCERTVERKCDPLALQAWALKLMAVPNGFSNGPVQIEKQPYVETNAPIFAALPPGLYGVWKHQYSPHVLIRDARDGEEGYIYLFWGSGMLGHWGMSIGSPTFVPAPSVDKMRLWKPGVYFWRDCH